jgi:hypothetical protein
MNLLDKELYRQSGMFVSDDKQALTNEAQKEKEKGNEVMWTSWGIAIYTPVTKRK